MAVCRLIVNGKGGGGFAEGTTMADITEEEKLHQINTSFDVDSVYLRALESLRQEMTAQGIDIDSGEGRKNFIRAVRKLNERFI